MNWRFWEPKHTLGSVTMQLLQGLRDGSVVVGDPLADESLQDDLNRESIVLQLDVPQEMSNDEILDFVKERVRDADKDNRNHGGPGLALETIRVVRPTVKIALRTNRNQDSVGAI